MIFAPIVEALDEWEIFDDTFCKRFFRRAPPRNFGRSLQSPGPATSRARRPTRCPPGSRGGGARLLGLVRASRLEIEWERLRRRPGRARRRGARQHPGPSTNILGSASWSDRLRQNRDVEMLCWRKTSRSSTPLSTRVRHRRPTEQGRRGVAGPLLRFPLENPNSCHSGAAEPNPEAAFFNRSKRRGPVPNLRCRRVRKDTDSNRPRTAADRGWTDLLGSQAPRLADVRPGQGGAAAGQE